MTRLALIGLGGALGAMARYGLSGWIQARSTSAIPWGTLGVNVLGCLLLGVLMEIGKERAVGSELQFFLRVGVLGAFTTFSTLGYETVELFSTQRLREGLISLGGNLLLGGMAVLLGSFLARLQLS